ncbi:ComEC family competence protein [Pelotomaculum schinkii]|uniref:ComEC family competence protein n=1 Tax=Pelotomaculum schinkii TaxID=78350 RepID=A0A4Y7RE39_9FIRM|nr:DNA internalization-related competence protein ComEC/Rec2 [Pelotomaculum schinkii]TEB07285.1 ComEC family competence protein [Pelotomaculum schinkii]
MQRPLVIFTALYMAGVLLGDLTGFKVSVALALAVGCFLVAVAGYTFAWRYNPGVILALFLLLGLAFSRLSIEESRTPLVDYAGQQVTLIGRLVSGADLRSDKVFYLCEARELVKGGERKPVCGQVRLSVKDVEQLYSYGDLLRITGLLYRPDPPGNPGAFNYRTYLERQGVWVTLSVNNKNSVEKIGEDGGNLVGRFALWVKQKLSTAATYTLPPSEAAVLNGVVFGTQGLIDRETREAFNETGIVHILSVSGLHVGLLLAGLVSLFGMLKISPGLTAPLATPVLLFYAIMTGINPAVMRATLMALLFLWARHLGRDQDWPTTLALAALVILLWNPLQIYHPGFQLSFAATWGLLYLSPLLAKFFIELFKGISPTIARAAAQGIAIPLAAQLATIPLVAWYYNLISPVSIPANLLAVPLVGLILALGLLAAGLGQVWLPLAGLVNAGTVIVVDLFLGLVQFLQQLPGAVVYLATPPALLAVAWYGGLLYAAGAAYTESGSPARQRLKSWAPAGAALVLVLLIIWWPWPGGKRMVVHFIDVGQGDSILVQTPGGKNMLIDTGGRREEFQTGTGTGDQVVAPYLRKIGVNRLDALVLTHPHEDHCGGAAYLINNFPVDLALVSPVGGGTLDGEPASTDQPAGGVANGTKKTGEEAPPAYIALLKKMIASGIQVQAAGSGDILRLDPEIYIEVLWPEENGSIGGAELNNASLVLRLTYGHSSFIFTGDIELEAQQKMLLSGEGLKSDVFKLPHHGSRSLLPELVDKVNPYIAVITVGAHNTFGHPAPSTVDLLYQEGVTIYRTDQDGAVIMETDGNRIEVKTGKKSS